MPDTKITGLAAIGANPINPATFPIPMVDLLDTSMAASGTTKKVTVNQILGAGGTATLASASITGAATVGGSLNVSGATNFTNSVVFTNAVTLGDAVGDAVTATGSFTSYTGQTPSAIRAAASDYAAAAFDGATASTRITSTLTGQNIGTGDFSVWARFRVPATAGGGRGIIQLSSPAAPLTSANGFDLYIRSGGSIAARINSATASDFRLSDGGNIITTYAGQVIDVVFTRTGSTVAMYINGTSVALTDTTGGTPPAWSGSITSTYCHTGAFDSTLSFFGRIYRSVVFNRALSASDVTELITTGVNTADQWGTQTQVIGFNPAVLNGGFETNLLNASGTWATSANGTSTATIDTSGSFSRTGTNAGKMTLDGSSSFVTFQANNGSTLLLTVNKRYRISIWARKGGASGNCGFNIGNNINGTAYGTSGLTLTTSYANTIVEVIAADRALQISRLATSAAGSEIYLDDIEVTPIGAIVDLDFTVGAGYQATDRSTNNLHGTLFNGVEFTVPRRMAVLYATTSTAAPQQMLGATLAIPTNAIIEDIIVNSTGTATVTIRDATPSGSIIVNGASVVSGRQKLTIAQPFSSTGNLWVSSSTTAVLQFTILYTVAA